MPWKSIAAHKIGEGGGHGTPGFSPFRKPIAVKEKEPCCTLPSPASQLPLAPGHGCAQTASCSPLGASTPDRRHDAGQISSLWLLEGAKDVVCNTHGFSIGHWRQPAYSFQ
jgi:hypothetical protein